MTPLVLAVSVGQIPNGKSHVSAVVVWIIVVAVIALVILGMSFLGRKRRKQN